MTKICIEDLTECKSLDEEALSRIRGGMAICEPYPGSSEGMIAKYLALVPEIPMPNEPGYPSSPGDPLYEPGGPLHCPIAQ